MSVTVNAKGTSFPSFTIGKTGITLYQGSSTPGSPATGDFWFNQSTNTLSTWNGSNWIPPTLGVHDPLIWPTTTGTNGQVLKTDGSGNLSWYTVSGSSAAGSDTQIQFNDGGSFGADANFTWNKTNNTLTLGSGSPGAGDPVISGDNIGSLSVSAETQLLHLIGGSMEFDTGGSVQLTIDGFGAWLLGGSSAGTSGQVLTSNGSGAAPTWQSSSGGVSSVTGTA